MSKLTLEKFKFTAPLNICIPDSVGSDLDRASSKDATHSELSSSVGVEYTEKPLTSGVPVHSAKKNLEFNTVPNITSSPLLSTKELKNDNDRIVTIRSASADGIAKEMKETANNITSSLIASDDVWKNVSHAVLTHIIMLVYAVQSLAEELRDALDANGGFQGGGIGPLDWLDEANVLDARLRRVEKMIGQSKLQKTGEDLDNFVQNVTDAKKKERTISPVSQGAPALAAHADTQKAQVSENQQKTALRVSGAGTLASEVKNAAEEVKLEGEKSFISEKMTQRFTRHLEVRLNRLEEKQKQISLQVEHIHSLPCHSKDADATDEQIQATVESCVRRVFSRKVPKCLETQNNSSNYVGQEGISYRKLASRILASDAFDCFLRKTVKECVRDTMRGMKFANDNSPKVTAELHLKEDEALYKRMLSGSAQVPVASKNSPASLASCSLVLYFKDLRQWLEEPCDDSDGLMGGTIGSDLRRRHKIALGPQFFPLKRVFGSSPGRPETTTSSKSIPPYVPWFERVSGGRGAVVWNSTRLAKRISVDKHTCVFLNEPGIYEVTAVLILDIYNNDSSRFPKRWAAGKGVSSTAAAVAHSSHMLLEPSLQVCLDGSPVIALSGDGSSCRNATQYLHNGEDAARPVHIVETRQAVYVAQCGKRRLGEGTGPLHEEEEEVCSSVSVMLTPAALILDIVEGHLSVVKIS